jgi:hypothetical protein
LKAGTAFSCSYLIHWNPSCKWWYGGKGNGNKQADKDAAEAVAAKIAPKGNTEEEEEKEKKQPDRRIHAPRKDNEAEALKKKLEEQGREVARLREMLEKV